jgi:hypothetical protein
MPGLNQACEREAAASRPCVTATAAHNDHKAGEATAHGIFPDVRAAVTAALA